MNPRPDQIPRLAQLNVIMSCAPKYIESMVIGVANPGGRIPSTCCCGRPM